MREGDKERETGRHRERQTERHRDTESQRARERQRRRHRERDRARNRNRADREGDRQTAEADSQTDRSGEGRVLIYVS